MSLEIYVGPMFAGKTTKMIYMVLENQSNDKIAIDYQEEDEICIRKLCNHNNIALKNVYSTKYLEKLWKEDNTMVRAKHVYINECQFFMDLKPFVLECLKQEKNVYLFGLDGDFRQNTFGQTMELIPFCNHLEKITGICQNCNNDSVISYRKTANQELYLLDSTCYIPLCLLCYNNML